MYNRRSVGYPKNARYSGKSKDYSYSTPGSSRSFKALEPKITDTDLSNVPIIRQAENARTLPKYSAILAKNEEDIISMDDLDQLQQDLEKLLSTCAVRTRYFLGEMVDTDKTSDAQVDHRAYDKTPLKRKRPEEKSRLGSTGKSGSRVMKKHYLPSKYCNGRVYNQNQKITLPRNDHSEKFWASIDPYCAPASKDDVAFLDKLIQECSKEIDTNIVDLGRHYSTDWTDEALNDEQSLGKTPSKKLNGPDIRKNSLQAVVESLSAPQSQSHLVKNIENTLKLSKFMPTDLTKLKHSTSQKIGACFEKRLKHELAEHGIIPKEDLNKNVQEDEILTEIKKCQQELLSVNQYNIEELQKLRSVVMNDIRCNDLKANLNKVDKEILELYNKIISQQEDSEEFEKEPFTETEADEIEQKADALLKQQMILNREINSLTDMSMLY